LFAVLQLVRQFLSWPIEQSKSTGFAASGNPGHPTCCKCIPVRETIPLIATYRLDGVHHGDYYGTEFLVATIDLKSRRRLWVCKSGSPSRPGSPASCVVISSPAKLTTSFSHAIHLFGILVLAPNWTHDGECSTGFHTFVLTSLSPR
jgi:hypothetical protein